VGTKPLTSKGPSSTLHGGDDGGRRTDWRENLKTHNDAYNSKIAHVTKNSFTLPIVGE